MSDSNDIYHPPQHISSTALPDEIVEFLDGENLDRKTSQALRLSTVDERGWPHAAMLSAGDIIALDHSRIGIVLYAESTTSKNLARDGRLTLTFPRGRGLCEVRLRAKEENVDGQYRYVIATVEDVREHLAHYADVLSGVTFRLHDPASVIKRWKSQIASLRKLS
jgi:hypothetical protein